MKFVKFPSIDQFRNIVKNITFSSAYVGQDENDKPIHDMTRERPVIKFQGTIKLHGTNAGVGYDGTNVWAQKRGGICTVEKDNAGFAFFVESNKEYFKQIFSKWNLPEGANIVLFGEWCGGNIQKGVGISKLNKMFVIFDAKISDPETTEFWCASNTIAKLTEGTSGLSEARIYNIYDFPTFEINIDFNNPELVQDKLIDITNNVEKECPVAKKFDISGIGEGVVWRGIYDGEVHRFKVKGEKHSISKVKTLAAVDVEKITKCKDFVTYALTQNRLEQAINEVFTSNNEEPDKRKTGDFIRWVINDIEKEEMDTMVENELEPKDVNKYLGEATRSWFFKLLGP